MFWVYCRIQFKAMSFADNKELLDYIKFLHISWPPDLLLTASEDLNSVDIVRSLLVKFAKYVIDNLIKMRKYFQTVPRTLRKVMVMLKL
jgi:hypothetical protein